MCLNPETAEEIDHLRAIMMARRALHKADKKKKKEGNSSSTSASSNSNSSASSNSRSNNTGNQSARASRASKRKPDTRPEPSAGSADEVHSNTDSQETNGTAAKRLDLVVLLPLSHFLCRFQATK